MSVDKRLERMRVKLAEAAGEGSYLSPTTGEWCQVDVTFYPKEKLWITEGGKRRQTSKEELKRQGYRQLQV